jgi:folate/biopterin transporter
MKPIIGLISDCFPILGYNKGPYIAIFSVAGCVALAVLAKVPTHFLPVEGAVICLFLMSLQFSTCDLLTEAKYAEKMQNNPAHGPDLMTYVWFGLQMGGLGATLLVGSFMDHFGVKAIYAVAILPAAFILLPVTRNYLEERKRTPEEVVEARSKFLEQKECCFLCLLMFAGTLMLTFLGIVYEDVHINCAAALVVAVVMLVAFSVLLRPMIAKVNAFFLLQTSLGFSIGGASFYFYTDSPAKYHAGPHFSMEFYTSVLGTVGSLCSLVGIYTYQRYMREWKYTNLLLMTNVVLSLLSSLDVIMLSRLNVKWGIPDHVFVMGASVFQTVIAQWMWMPGVVILSQLCPKGMEATMYALLAGCHNLGNTIASNTGAVVLLWLGCDPSGADNEDDQFKNLWIGSVFSTVLPMFTLLLLPYLIPDARQTDKLMDDEDRDATTGSLWRRWRGY